MKFNNILVVNNLMDDYNKLIKLSKFNSTFVTPKTYFKNGFNMINTLDLGIISLINSKLKLVGKNTEHTVFSVYKHTKLEKDEKVDLKCVLDYMSYIDKNMLIINLDKKYSYEIYDNTVYHTMEINDENLKTFTKLGKKLSKEENHWIFEKNTFWIRINGFWNLLKYNSKKDLQTVFNNSIIRYCLHQHAELPINIKKDIKQQLDIDEQVDIKDKHMYKKFKLSYLEITYLEYWFKTFKNSTWVVK